MSTQEALPGMGQLATRQTTPMDLLQTALSNNAAIDVIERLSALHKDAMRYAAEMAFNQAMNAAQAEIVRVAPDLPNNQTNSKYASYAALDKVLRPVYLRHGFSLSFDTEPLNNVEMVRVLCYVSHCDGHSRTYRYDMPADGKGAKGGDVMTKTHARGAAGSYGMRYLLKMIFNVAIGEEDRDGNAVDDGGLNLTERLEWIASASATELPKIFDAAFSLAREARNTKAMSVLTNAKNQRRRELGL